MSNDRVLRTASSGGWTKKSLTKHSKKLSFHCCHFSFKFLLVFFVLLLSLSLSILLFICEKLSKHINQCLGAIVESERKREVKKGFIVDWGWNISITRKLFVVQYSSLNWNFHPNYCLTARLPPSFLLLFAKHKVLIANFFLSLSLAIVSKS